MGLAEDASSPAVATITGSGAVTTASFSPPAGSLLVAMACSAFATSGNSTVVTLSDSGGHTWTQAVLEQDARSASNNSGGTVGIWWTYLSTAPGAMTVSMSATNMGGGASLCVKVITGAASTQNGATAHSEFGATTNTTTGSTAITTTKAGSIVYGVVDDGEAGSTFTANAATTVINTYADSTDIVTIVDIKSGVTGTPGSVTLGGTWSTTTDSRIALFEVLPAAGSMASAALMPGVSSTGSPNIPAAASAAAALGTAASASPQFAGTASVPLSLSAMSSPVGAATQALTLAASATGSPQITGAASQALSLAAAVPSINTGGALLTFL